MLGGQPGEFGVVAVVGRSEQPVERAADRRICE